MSCAELFEPTTTQCLPAQPSPPACWLEWCCVPLNVSAPGNCGISGKPDMPVASTRCFGRTVTGLAVALDDDRPFAAPLVPGARLARRRRPVVELHDLRIGLEPVAHLVLGRVDRPVVGERQVRQMVVPDRIVQAERLVALAPGVARPLVRIDDQRRHADAASAAPPSPMPPCPPPTISTKGWRVTPSSSASALAAVAPGHAVPERAVLGAERRGSGRPVSSKPFSSISAVKQRRRLAVLQPDVAAAAADRGLEGEPAFVAVRPRKADGRTSPSRAFSMSAIAVRPSKVTMFQVKATRSRQ